jgi:nucleotide-binding universal stress UspA family protein
MFQKILVPIDDSDPSAAGLALALDIAAAASAEIVFCHVVDPTQVPLLPGRHTLTTMDDIADAEMREGWKAGRQLLEAAQRRAASRGILASCALVTGDTVDRLVAQVDAHGVDLIAMGSHRRRGWQRVLWGSIAESVLRRVSVPLLVTAVDERRGHAAAT